MQLISGYQKLFHYNSLRITGRYRDGSCYAALTHNKASEFGEKQPIYTGLQIAQDLTTGFILFPVDVTTNFALYLIIRPREPYLA